MLPTPSTTHVPSQVYPVSEDSFLVLDTISSTEQASFLSSRFPQSSSSPLLVEVGTGSGVVLAFATANTSAIFARPDVISLGVDVNSYACRAAWETVKLASEESPTRTGTLLGCVQSDLLTALRPKSVDVLIFNPPYVPTPSLPSIRSLSPSGARDARDAAFREESHLLELAYAGGELGMETTERFLEQVQLILSDRGVFYLLLCAGNKPDQVKERIQSWLGGWKADIVGTSGKTAGWERLVIVRGYRMKSSL